MVLHANIGIPDIESDIYLDICPLLSGIKYLILCLDVPFSGQTRHRDQYRVPKNHWTQYQETPDIGTSRMSDIGYVVPDVGKNWPENPDIRCPDIG